MKKNLPIPSLLILLLTIALFTACSPGYIGKTYAPTQNVDIYMNVNDIKRPYTTMGSTEVELTLKSRERAQQELVNIGKSKGADGVIISLEKEVTSTQTNTSGTVKKGQKENEHNSSSTTSVNKEETLKGLFIKYN